MILSNEQKIDYLSNVISVAYADGKIAPQETEAIAVIQKAIGARKTELNKAYKQVDTNNFAVSPVGYWSDKIKNLEHIIYVSLIDGEIDPKEKELILNFAKKVNINQDQLNLIINDVKNAVSSSEIEISCLNCKAKIPDSAKFCPKCGQQVNKSAGSQPIAVSYKIPESGIAVEFAESTAANFFSAVKVMENAPVSRKCVKGKKQWYLACWPSENILDALELIENVDRMRNKKVYFDGEESQWNDIFGFVKCAASRNSAYRPVEYCFGLDDNRFNVWGCKKARMGWNEWADWFGYGAFQSSDRGEKVSFVFDKKRIRHELESNLYTCRLCPYLQLDLIEAILEVFPNKVTPRDKGNWKYKRDFTETPNSIIVKTGTDFGLAYLDEYYSSGVLPSSIDVGINLLRKALRKCNRPSNDIKGVLEYQAP
ncbi:MAG: zinc ribbon domain-containing protein [Candidatus Electrothrix sp. Rat3]|nr:zinc ribbon domain-containing protein [Candidatus Electrothrix rattekaaiensis]